ncbi:unnamed protein product [Rangifer tarandus platyrhynchus]|uniref:Uncharacterized protein n=1 Tax=Rangifer tarandus platyrhynchus TaxID=3082113 RepID=A0AC59YP72_RANTA
MNPGTPPPQTRAGVGPQVSPSQGAEVTLNLPSLACGHSPPSPWRYSAKQHPTLFQTVSKSSSHLTVYLWLPPCLIRWCCFCFFPVLLSSNVTSSLSYGALVTNHCQ